MNLFRKSLRVVALCLLLVPLLGIPQAFGDETLPFVVAGVFGDHAVLQQEVNVPVWGTAAPGASVQVEFGDQVRSAIAGDAGRWTLNLDPMKASADGRRLIVRSGEASQVFQDVVVGEVWIASGQSNMQFSLDACAKRLEAARNARSDPEILGVRTLRIGGAEAAMPLHDIGRTRFNWKRDSPEVRGGQSAVAFFFARRLYEELRIPIGIIETSWGGKPIEGFIPRAEFEFHEALQPILRLADENRLEELKRLEGGVFVRNKAGLPGRIFNGRLAPVAPFAARGFIWYQGESNAGVDEDPRNYRYKMRALVEGWRRAWLRPMMPFYFVQLPGFRDEYEGWVRLREEQRLSMDIPHTGMAVTIDLRDPDIHPANKIDVGERLAKWPLALDYGKEGLVCSGPLFEAAEIEGARMRVRFANAGDGLMVARKEGLKPPEETSNSPLAEFEVADRSGAWHPASATIEGKTVLVHSDSVSHPAAVRYACRGAPDKANLYNRAGLPASPFCSRLEFLPWSRRGLEARR